MGPSKDIYTLAREPTETERLNAQHKQLISCIGYTLHPSIVATLPTAPKVAELATGTGAFIIDLAKELSPDAQLDGTDYSDAALPCQGQLPSNVRLGVADAKQAPPEESTGKYDVVCIRYINPAMMPEDWAKVAAHAAALLKPGGALQFAGMGDFTQVKTVLGEHPGAFTAVTERAGRLGLASLPHASWFVSNLFSVLVEAGFRDMRREVTTQDREPGSRSVFTKMSAGAIYALLRQQYLSKAERALGEEEVEEMRRGMDEEARKGMYMRCDLHQFVAWKKG